MLKNFLFVLKRFKTSSVINILGLSVAFAVFMVVVIQVKYDFTFDRSYPDAGEIYMYSMLIPADKTPYFHINRQVPQEIKDALPEIKACCVVLTLTDKKEMTILSPSGEKQVFREKILGTTPGFLDIFSPAIIAGSTAGLFVEKDKVMISRQTAERFFGRDNPVGKSLDNQYTVAAVYEDFPENSSIANDIYAAAEETERYKWNYNSFFKLSPADYAHINEKINAANINIRAYGDDVPDEEKYQVKLIPLSDYYLHYSGKGSPAMTLALLSIGVVIIVIAFINFVNLTVALIPSRIRSVNIKKILGVDLSCLRHTVAMEAVFLTLLAFALACCYIYAFSDVAAGLFFSADLSPAGNVPVIAVIGAGLLALSFVLGLYPAYYATSVSPAMALSGSFSLSPVGVRLRNILIVVQFAASIVLIVFSGFINLQQMYMQDYDLGYQKENIIYLSGKDMKSNVKSFKDDVMRNPSITDITGAGFIPGDVKMDWGYEFHGKPVNIFAWPVAANFLDFFGIPVVYGNRFDPADDSGRDKVIFNEAFLHRYEFDEAIVGSTFSIFGETDVAGIAKDVNFASLHESVKPMGFFIINETTQWDDNYLYLKLAGGDIRSTIDYVRGVWEKHNDKPFEFAFLDARLDELYKNENNLAKVISIFGLIAVIIAVMGVYGLVVFNARYKAKEIAIRKVNGSTTEEIMLLLNRNVLVQLGIAFVIAVPAAYFAVGKWLENFAYKTDVYWWVFLLGGVVVLVITVLTVSTQSYRAASRNPTKALNSQ